MKIAIVCFDNFTDIDVFLPWDLLNRVHLVGGISDWEVQLLGTEKTHVSMSGLRIPMTGSISDIPFTDAVIFASGKGVQDLYKNQQYLNNIHVNPQRQLIGSMCSGSLLLGAKKLLTGKKATTYPSVVEQLKEFDVDVIEQSFVNEGNISTAAGCFAAQDLSAWIIRTLINEEMVGTVLETVQPVGKGLYF
ncbi:DJ-1/PfpI family protein [Bacillus cytotoxicus]|uniref:ThiJ/PfpI domain protein n=1 Tax=Bacillus cytotoxicus (strain DSM 22905 / CIP 110041 / 391-98 / NVH 391-98) TaxID=315749 RepID=A7GR57_BACCN|nr:DJ-1/PfpI family protein [Bacillus cytotoxicus]ABS22615.1 ThiJ/PfpI domain protein [Bacillus cytotoxicus NVH 391-98]AWC45259.1 thiamine biosynthesis protein ThiJ [Bacillus cytotoxicus]MDH2865689.1 DJ-1/PfpI family protein [Bacillus cytotoxicus]MDH2885705.1 DJ-1/PfpI family protein [Bacillus cytotoxicus]MDH2889641.1 DJ-1/PfpI family protein [Bacillus cytotoxicus]